MSKILLTGVAGFIANRTCEMLLDQGHEVVGIDNINDYYDVNLKNFRLKNLEDRSGFHFYKMDIENKEDLETVFKAHSFDVILNLAARAGVRYSQEHPEVYVTTNSLGNLNLLNLARDYKVSKFLLASTSSLYAGKPMPFTEDLDVSEPISPYASTKKSAETMCYTYHHLYGIDVSIVRYFTVYGPTSRPDMAQLRFMKWIDEGSVIQLNGDGTQARDFTHVDDIARGTIAAMKPLGYEIINLGGGNNPIPINQMIELLSSGFGKKAKVKNHPMSLADMKETWANIEKAKRLLAWQPQINFEHGIDTCLKHYQDNLDFYKGIQL
ncbi:MAG: nucleotide sugar epimerase [Halobacteriovoraceae bacterium]|nr:nucleotide sugar epimerase [Halobacteriovoraceae bacterium]|tara:strand:+ start:3469 stop:4440 length:972 start_codon:yes stop_codon:yes gene_type:complete